MPTCEFCVYGTDECLLLHEPIEYDPSGMTIKENCPIHEKISILLNGRKTIRTAVEGNEQCPAGDNEPPRMADKENT